MYTVMQYSVSYVINHIPGGGRGNDGVMTVPLFKTRRSGQSQNLVSAVAIKNNHVQNADIKYLHVPSNC